MSARQFDFEMENAPEEIDLGGLAAALGRKKRMILTATLGAAALAFAFTMSVKPRYMAESRILVENQESYFTSAAPQGVAPVEIAAAPDAEAINSQIQLLTSRDLARRAVKQLGLQGHPEFDPTASGLGLLLHPLALFGIGKTRNDQSAEDRLLSTFIDHLTVMSPAKTRVLQVEFTSQDPDLAARAANIVAEIYIDMKSEAKREDAHQAAQALKPLIVSLEAKVAEADARVEAFRAKTGLYESAANTTVPTQQLGEIASKLADARAAQSQAQAKARALRDLLKQGQLADVGDFPGNDLVRRISDRRVTVRAQLATESRTLLPAHPRIKELQAELSDLDAQLRTAVEQAARGLDNDARVAAAQVANLEALLEQQKDAVGSSNNDAAQLRELERDAKILKDQLASLASKYQAALARDVADSAPPDARIISRALAPSQPVFPKKLPITIFAALAGLFFSVALVIVRELTGAGSRGQRRAAPPPEDEPEFTPFETQASEAVNLPAEFFGRIKQAAAEYAAPAVRLEDEAQSADLGSAEAVAEERRAGSQDSDGEEVDSSPEAGESKTPTIMQGPRSGVSKAVVERIAATAADGGAKILVVSDTDSAAGCASLALARALAREGRAILLQIDDSDAALAEALAGAQGNAGLDDGYDDFQPGLTHLLSGEASFAETIYRDGASRLHIIQSGGPVWGEPADIDLILDALQATYEFSVIAACVGPEAARIARDADLTVIYAENARARDYLSDDLVASGARATMLAGRDSHGEISEMAA